MKELDIVITKSIILDVPLVPEGIEGTIVHCHSDSEWFEVEFEVKGRDNIVLTVHASQLRVKRYYQFVAFFWFVSWKCISLGVSVNLWPIHVEIHLPFGFIRIGMVRKTQKPYNADHVDHRGFGLRERYLLKA